MYDKASLCNIKSSCLLSSNSNIKSTDNNPANYIEGAQQ